MSPKAPAARGFTRSEKRSLQFETVSLYVVFLVALIAMIVSFVALTWLGGHMRLGFAAWLVPLMIDGFGVACSVGIVRSQAAGEPARARISEWLGLSFALGLSILGNVYHVLDVVPDWLKIAVASCIPIIVAYGIHVYGRAMSRGISAHVMADEPDKLHFDLAHLGDERASTVARQKAPTTRAAAKTRTQPTGAPAARVPSEDSARAAVTPAHVARAEQEQPARAARAKASSEDHERAYAAYRDARDAGKELDSNELGELLGCHPGNARNVRNQKFRPRYEAERASAQERAADPEPSDPIDTQVQADEQQAREQRPGLSVAQ